jgi:steroid 5-alpha reductase family enzyme
VDFIVLSYAAAGLALAMGFAWGLQRLTGSSGWIDAIWSAATGVAGVGVALGGQNTNTSGRAVLVAVLVGLWASRLALHISARTFRAGEDPRYAELARKWGRSFSLRLLIFVEIQALAALPLVASIRLAAANPAPFPRLVDLIAVAAMLISFAGEAIADAQLQRFRFAHRGERALCDSGLWSWSRHPNYFFEWLGWCGYPLLAIDFSGSNPDGWYALAAPVLMYVLLVHVSGIPPLERHLAATRGPAFVALKNSVSAFFPLPPKKQASIVHSPHKRLP